MDLISLVLVLVVVGVVLWVVNTLLPIDGKIKQIINIVVILVVLFWLIGVFVPGLRTIHIG